MFGKNETDLCGFDKKPCIKERCHHWIHVTGKHPQTDAPVDLYDCAFSWMPVLLMENSKEQRHTGAAVESFRNEMVRGNDQLLLAAGKK